MRHRCCRARPVLKGTSLRNAAHRIRCAAQTPSLLRQSAAQNGITGYTLSLEMIGSGATLTELRRIRQEGFSASREGIRPFGLPESFSQALARRGREEPAGSHFSRRTLFSTLVVVSSFSRLSVRMTFRRLCASSGSNQKTLCDPSPFSVIRTTLSSAVFFAWIAILVVAVILVEKTLLLAFTDISSSLPVNRTSGLPAPDAPPAFATSARHPFCFRYSAMTRGTTSAGLPPVRSK